VATCIFRSAMSHRLGMYLETRCLGGQNRVLEIKRLTMLDRFFRRTLSGGQAITREIVEKFVDSLEHLNPSTRCNYICWFKNFCIYLSHFDRRTCFVYVRGPRRKRRPPHIFSRAEVCRIIAAGSNVPDEDGLRRELFGTLVGLLFATGLRIGEAIRLTLGDVNLEKGLLEVRKTKFNKKRYVTISGSTSARLAHYLRLRKRAGHSLDSKARFFPSSRGHPLGYTYFVETFLRVIRRIGLRAAPGQPGPHLHDLRHSFAVSRLVEWQRAGENLNAKLPVLATYLGHSTLSGLNVYLHTTAEMLEKASQRFHDHFAIPFRRKERCAR